MGKAKKLFKNPFEKKAVKPKVASRQVKKVNGKAEDAKKNAEIRKLPGQAPQDTNVVEQGRPRVDNFYNCAACGGGGLKNQTTLCPECNGTGRV